MIFEVGQLYENNIGTYEVLSICDDVMDVRYADGHKQTLSIAIQSKIYENRLLAQTTRQSLTTIKKRRIDYSYSDYYTLGFLLDRLMHLEHKVMYDKQTEAKDKYLDITGQELDDVKTGVFYYRKGANQWGNQGVITFHAKENELPLLKFNSTPSPISNSPNTYVVSDINYFYFMLQNGFILGSKQDKDSMRNNTPPQYQDAFNKGYDYAKGRN